ncbi:hypothetical protein D3C78_493960 [compost metagenome]
MGRQGVEQVGHHFQVDHRRLVDHQHVQRQRIASVMPEMPGARTAAQQTMDRGHVRRDLVSDIVGDLQRTDLLADGLGQPRGSLAGRRREPNAQRLLRLHGGRLEQRQQAHDGGGFTGAWPASDDAECTTGGQGTGQLLPIDRGTGLDRSKQPVEAFGQISRDRFMGHQPFAQCAVDAPLVRPVPSQVQALAGQHQRPVPGLFSPIGGQRHQRAGRQHLAPVGAFHGFQQLRGQQAGTGLHLAFRRQGQGEVRLLERLEQVKADVTVPQLVTGQCARQQHQGVTVRVALMEEGDKGLVQRPQPAALDPALKQQQQVLGTAQGRQLRQTLGRQGCG